MLERPGPVDRPWLSAANVLLLALVVACGNDDSADVGSGSSVDGPVVAHPSEGDGSGSEALTEGPLTMSGGCLLVGEFPVVWPYGTTWDAEAETVRLSDGRAVALGDRVSGGGGYPYVRDLRTELAEPLADCPTNRYDEVAMFNAGEQITVAE